MYACGHMRKDDYTNGRSVHPLRYAEEHAIVSDSLGIRHSDLVEPLATYNILRLKKDILNNSSIGFVATHGARSTERPATTSGLDRRLNFLVISTTSPVR